MFGFGVVDSIAKVVNSVVTRIWPDKSEADRNAFSLAVQRELAESKIIEGQLKINANEASSSSAFVAGWRPGLAWVLVLAFAWTYLFVPMISFGLVLAGKPLPVFPGLDMEMMLPVLFGILGLGTMRTVEKVKGTSSKGK